eukprot:TRINITY_DN5412_c0_g1_i1.p1 TRINITY_DN5412_c0_g1~~TRINITY_DN5412_c0_g1_i1.p1  ORF type:complete len:598 (+),score=61.62 TRINITY_DN5412_c0_g1_i1:84-1796(+)
MSKNDDSPNTQCGKVQAKLSPVTYMKRLKNDFGSKFIVMLFSTYFGVKGGLYTLFVRGQMPYYLDYIKASGADYQRYGTFSVTPWAMKAMIGALSETVPVMGYHKTFYIVGATFFGLLGFTLLAILPLAPDDPGSYSPVNETTLTMSVFESGKTMLAPLLFFGISTQIATVDILVEGRYASMMVEKPETGGSLVTWVWVSYFLGSLVVCSIIGPITNNNDARILFFIGIPLSLQILLPIAKGCLLEERVSTGVRTDKYRDQPKLYFMAALMTIGALTSAICGMLLESDTTVLVITWSISLSLIAISYWALPRALASANTYMFLVMAFYIQIPGVLDPWYTAGEACVPDGPNFSKTYYITYSGVVGSLAALIGVCIFQIVFKNSTFRRAFWMTTVIKVVACVFDVIIVKRWHRPAVPDKVMYMFGDAIISEIANQLDFMPAVVLISKLCPPGYEAIVYAMLGGFQNFGMQVSRNTGGFLASSFGIVANEHQDECEFGNLPLLIFICHMVFPLFTVPLTFFLLPDARLTDEILTPDHSGYVLEMYSVASDEDPPSPENDSFVNDANEALCIN